MSEKLVLDSFALVSLFHREPGWKVVQAALYEQEKARMRAVLNWINWGEFFYIVKRRVGAAKGIETLRLLEQLPIELFPVDQPLVRAAAEIKSDHALSYADAFCVAIISCCKEPATTKSEGVGWPVCESCAAEEAAAIQAR